MTKEQWHYSWHTVESNFLAMIVEACTAIVYKILIIYELSKWTRISTHE